MKTLLLIGLIISMLVMAIRIYGWIRGTIVWFTNPDSKYLDPVKENFKLGKWAFIFGGLEHLILFGSLLAATLIIY